MSQAESSDPPIPDPKRFRPGTGDNRYARFAAEALGVERTEVLDEILYALSNYQQTCAVGANGVGKSFTASVAGIAALYCNVNTVVPVTAGTGGTLEDNIWKPIKSLFRDSPLPGRVIENKRELRTEFDPEWYLKCVAPKYPDDLEGDHNDNVLYIVEEADKPGISYDHIDSVRSTITDKEDRVLVVANPPEDESNCVYRLLRSDQWQNLKFSSWDSHNVKVETGEIEGDKIGGLADIHKLKQDWMEYHGEEWPGLEQVREWSDPWYGTDNSGVVTPREPPNEEFRDDLHTKWFKRRAGVVPPQGAEAWRPFSIADVRNAWQREAGETAATPDVFAVDVARMGGDKTIGTALYGETAEIAYNKKGADFHKQRLELQQLVDNWKNTPVVVDAVAEGSGIADELSVRYGDVTRFNSQEQAIQKNDYKSRWAEGLQEIGTWLRGRGTFSNEDLYEELMITARTVEFTETSLRRGNVVEATPKRKIKDELGHSPDFVDSLLMALHKRDIINTNRGKVSPTFSW